MEEGWRVRRYASRWGVFASFHFQSCIAPVSSFHFDGCYFKICTQSGFCLCRAVRTAIWATEIWKETGAAFNNWNWQIGSLEGKLQQSGKWPIFQPRGIMSISKNRVWGALVYWQELLVITHQFGFYCCTEIGRLTWSTERWISILFLISIVFNFQRL